MTLILTLWGQWYHFHLTGREVKTLEGDMAFPKWHGWLMTDTIGTKMVWLESLQPPPQRLTAFLLHWKDLTSHWEDSPFCLFHWWWSGTPQGDSTHTGIRCWLVSSDSSWDAWKVDSKAAKVDFLFPRKCIHYSGWICCKLGFGLVYLWAKHLILPSTVGPVFLQNRLQVTPLLSTSMYSRWPISDHQRTTGRDLS